LSLIGVRGEGRETSLGSEREEVEHK
jgi:hypothetical protein